MTMTNMDDYHIINTSTWKWFRLDELFVIKKGKRLTKAQMESGITPYIGAISDNNGIATWISNKPIHQGNVITVNYDGSIAEAFYQPSPFWCSDAVNVLYPQFDMNPYIAMFLICIIKLEKYRYNYGRKWHLDRMNTTQIKLPVIEGGTPDWLYMDNFIRSMPSITSVGDKINLERCEVMSPAILEETPLLSTDKWKSYKIKDLFYIKKGKRLTKANMTIGETPFIGAIDSNNGLTAFISLKPIHTGNVITVNYNGGVAEAFYQTVPFWCSDDVNVLYPKFPLNSYIALFICTIIRLEKYRFNYGRKWHVNRMKESEIKLPAKLNGTPDWDFIERYIKTLPFSAQI